MQTSVEWLQAEFNKWAEGKVFIPQDLLEEAKQKEKEQIIYDYMNGKYYHQYEDITAEEYYNQTYNENK
jgi:hypothetical protein